MLARTLERVVDLKLEWVMGMTLEWLVGTQPGTYKTKTSSLNYIGLVARLSSLLPVKFSELF